MIRKLSAGLVVTLCLVGVVYLGLLTNWFRYGLSLEATFVAIPLVLGTLVSSVFAVLAWRGNSTRRLLAAFVGTGLTGLLERNCKHLERCLPSMLTMLTKARPIGS